MFIKGEERNYLRDTRTCVDLCESSMISHGNLLPENVWIKQPFDATCRCLPFAKTVIEGDLKKMEIKATVKPADITQGLYLMGNRTTKFIEEQKTKINPINAVMTRSMIRGKSENKEGKYKQIERRENKFQSSEKENLNSDGDAELNNNGTSEGVLIIEASDAIIPSREGS